MNILLIILSVCATWFAQLLFRLGMRWFEFDWILNFLVFLIKNVYIVAWVFVMIVWMFLWFFVLSKNEVSFAYPFTAISYIIVLVGGFFLGEDISVFKIVWIALILCWLIFIVKS